MNNDTILARVKRLIAVSTAAALLLLSPGPRAFAAMAHVVTKVAVNPGLSQAGAGAGIAGLSVATGLLTPQSGHSLSLNGVLPSAAVNPAIDHSLGQAFTVQGVAGTHILPVASRGISTLSPVGSAAVAAQKAAVQGVSLQSSSKAVPQTVIGRLSASVSDIPRMLGFSGTGLKSEAGRAFEGAARRQGSAVSPVASGQNFGTFGRVSGLNSVADSGPAAKKSPAVDAPAAPKADSAPRQKISRAIRIGALTAILMLALDMVVMAAATSLGYQFVPSYQMPALSDPAAFAMFGDFLAPILAKVQEFLTAAWVAPFNEEVYFRAGVIGFAGFGAMKTAKWGAGLIQKVFKKATGVKSWIVPAAFGMAATEAAMLFALLHEMSDPILITIRIAQALLFSYLYVREGLVSGIAHHAVFNGLAVLTLPIVYGVSAAGMTVLAAQSYLVAAALAAVAFVIWRLTRNTAKKEAGEIRQGTLAPYRLSIKGSKWLARAGWVTAAVLGGMAFLQPTSSGALMMGAMAAQVVPAALALQAYAFLLRNLERREGKAAVDRIRNPDSPLPLGNRIGAWAGGIFGAMYVGLIAGPYYLNLLFSVLPMAMSLPMQSLAAAALPLLALAVLTYFRLRAGKKGISPWIYISQYFFGTVAVIVGAMPWLTPLLDKLVTWIASANLSAGAVVPALAGTLWTIPAFIVLAMLMTVVGRKIIARLSPPAASTAAAK